jgi:hypothetical protein
VRINITTLVAIAFVSIALTAKAVTPESQFDYTPVGTTAVSISKYKGSDAVVVIPQTIAGKTVVAIGPIAFVAAPVTSVSIPNTVTNIGANAFLGCASLTNVSLPESLITIEAQVFSDCTSLKTINIPASVSEIGSLVFWRCPNLESFTVAAENSKFTSQDGVLFDKAQKTLMNYPAAKPGAFIIPNTVNNIVAYAFADSHALTNVSIPNSVTTISNDAFENSGIFAAIIPDSVTNLGYDAFFSCTNLISATIPNTITNLAYGMFGGCVNLRDVTLPQGLVEIGNSAFEGCASLREINLPDGLTLIWVSAFKGCSNLTSLKIPDSVLGAFDSSFENCSRLTNVTLGSGLPYLTRLMFAGCSSLTNITIPSNIKEIESGAFNFCTNLEAVYFEGEPPYLPDDRIFFADDKAILYYLPGTTWPAQFGERLTVLWNPTVVAGSGEFSPQNGQFKFDIAGSPGITVVVESATDLSSPNWQTVETIRVASDPFPFTDPQANSSQRFYRFRSP